MRVIVAGRNSSQVYYTADYALYTANVDTGKARKIADLPARGGILRSNMFAPAYVFAVEVAKAARAAE